MSTPSDPPDRDDGEGSVTIRLAQLDMTRATEQSAIILALLMGRGQEKGHRKPPRKKRTSPASTENVAAPETLVRGNEPREYGEGEERAPTKKTSNKTGGLRKATFEEQARSSLKGYLGRTYCPGFADFPGEGEPHRFGTAATGWEQLRCIAQPCDGLSDLQAGHWGSATVIAGGPPAWVIPRPPEEPKHYFVVTTPPGELKTTLLAAGKEVGGRALAPVTKLEKLLQKVRGSSKDHPLQFTMGALFVKTSAKEQHERAFSRIHGLISRFSRLMSLTGSPISGAVAACLPHYGVDVFTALASQVQARLMAAAAYATGGGFLALPFSSEESRAADATFLGLESFVSNRCDVFLVATGITKHPVLDGVHFLDDAMVSTQTMVLRANTRSTRFISHHHQLLRKRFYLLQPREGGKELTYRQLLDHVSTILGEPPAHS